MKPGEMLHLGLTGDPSADVLVTAFETDEGHDCPIPRGLWLEVAGAVPVDLDVQASLAPVAVGVANILGLAANASVGEPQLLYSLADNGSAPAEFYQRVLQEPSGLPRVGRALPTLAASVLLKVIAEHSHGSGPIARACAQYNEALRHWKPGYDIQRMAHLFMAAEPLAPAIRSDMCQTKGVDRADLARSFGIDIDDCGRWQNALDGLVKLDAIFEGDRDCYQAIKKASDGFEHGFLSYDDIRHLMGGDIVVRSAGYIRRAILKLCELDAETASALLSAPYDKPCDAMDVAYAVGGFLEAPAGVFEMGAPRPKLRGRHSIKSARRTTNGKVQYEWTMNAEVSEVPAGQVLKINRTELWGPDGEADVHSAETTYVPAVGSSRSISMK